MVRLQSVHLKGQYHLSSSLFPLFPLFCSDESLSINLPPTYLPADYPPIHPSGWCLQDGSLLRQKAVDEVPALPAGALCVPLWHKHKTKLFIKRTQSLLAMLLLPSWQRKKMSLLYHTLLWKILYSSTGQMFMK